MKTKTTCVSTLKFFLFCFRTNCRRKNLFSAPIYYLKFNWNVSVKFKLSFYLFVTKAVYNLNMMEISTFVGFKSLYWKVVQRQSKGHSLFRLGFIKINNCISRIFFLRNHFLSSFQYSFKLTCGEKQSRDLTVAWLLLQSHLCVSLELLSVLIIAFSYDLLRVLSVQWKENFLN